MTAPVSHGYPDFNRAAPFADVLLVSDAAGATSGTKSYGVQFVGNARALFVWVSVTGNNARVRLAFYGDAAGTNLLETTFIHGLNGDLITQPVRVLGPYVQVMVDAGSGLPTTWSIQVWAASDYGTFNSAGLLSGALAENNTAIGAGATITRDISLVMSGPASWFCFCAAATWVAVLQVVDYTGAVTVIDIVSNSYQGGVMRALYLPPVHVQLKVTNTGAASAFNAGLTRLHT